MNLLKADAVAKMLSVSKPLVYKLADQGRMPCVRIECPGQGTKKPRTLVRFKLEDICRFIDQRYGVRKT